MQNPWVRGRLARKSLKNAGRMPAHPGKTEGFAITSRFVIFIMKRILRFLARQPREIYRLGGRAQRGDFNDEKVVSGDFINKLETVGLYMQASMEGWFGGRHRVNKYGNTVEFADFREYTFGDDLRRIDWNLYGRFEKHFINLFVDERQMFNQIFLDCSASMTKPDRRKAVYAMRAAAGIGFLSVKNMDKTSIKLIYGGFADDHCGIVTGKETFFQAAGGFEGLEFRDCADITEAVTSCRNLGLNDGLTVIISDFLTENDWKKAVDYLLYRKRQVMLIQILSPEDINPLYNGKVRLLDTEAENELDGRIMKMRITRAAYKAYMKALEDYTEEIKSFCTSRGVFFISASSGEPIEKLFFEKIFITGTIK